MIYEVVEFQVKESMQDAFIEGTLQSKSIFQKAPGFIGLHLHQEIEDPLNFIVIVSWESIQHHLDMQKTDLYPQIRAKVADCFAGPPKVRHTSLKVEY